MMGAGMSMETRTNILLMGAKCIELVRLWLCPSPQVVGQGQTVFQGN